MIKMLEINMKPEEMGIYAGKGKHPRRQNILWSGGKAKPSEIRGGGLRTPSKPLQAHLGEAAGSALQLEKKLESHSITNERHGSVVSWKI